jgi:DNA (cytosine-5)-methyltransferase 1
MTGRKKTKKKNIVVVDLFCGVGGLSHGFVQEGLRVAAGVDLDPACEYAYQSNNNGKFIKADITNLSGEDLNKHFGNADVKILAGCAPCQPFSSYAQRYDEKRDNKWNLLEQFSRLVEECQPQVVTMENVPALRDHQVFSKFVASLERQEYEVWFDVVDSSLYGVPQTRKRLVLLASKFGKIEIIPPTTRLPVTVRKAIGDIPRLKAGQTHSKDRIHTASSLSETNLKRIKASKPGGTWKDWPKELVAKCHKVESGKTYAGVYGRMEWDKPAPTMTTQCFGFGNGRFGHPTQARAISLREAAILQSFPKRYKFVDENADLNIKELGRLIGNAVPVKLGRAIAKSISLHVKQQA